MSKSKKPSSGWDAEALRAQSVAQSLRMVEMVDEADKRSIGTWYRLPRGTENWHYVRCGLKGQTPPSPWRGSSVSTAMSRPTRTCGSLASSATVIACS